MTVYKTDNYNNRDTLRLNNVYYDTAITELDNINIEPEDITRYSNGKVLYREDKIKLPKEFGLKITLYKSNEINYNLDYSNIIKLLKFNKIILISFKYLNYHYINQIGIFNYSIDIYDQYTIFNLNCVEYIPIKNTINVNITAG